MKLFKMHEGFNTDDVRRGDVFYIHFTEVASLDRLKVGTEFKGNVLIIRSRPNEFVFSRVTDKDDYNTAITTTITYESTQNGTVHINHMRKLE